MNPETPSLLVRPEMVPPDPPSSGGQDPKHDRESSRAPSPGCLAPASDPGAFRERLQELLTRIDLSGSPRHIDLRTIFQWKMQVQWLLIQYLGDTHPYTVEFCSAVKGDVDTYSNANLVTAGQGILAALLEDLDNGRVALMERGCIDPKTPG